MTLISFSHVCYSTIRVVQYAKKVFSKIYIVNVISTLNDWKICHYNITMISFISYFINWESKDKLIKKIAILYNLLTFAKHFLSRKHAL